MSIQPEPPPLRIDPDGTIRVGTSRVVLDVIIRAYQAGHTPEAIAEDYPAVSLAEVDGVIAYYLRHRAEVDEYLAERERKGEELRRWFEDRQGKSADLREQLLARRHGETSPGAGPANSTS